MVQFKSSGPVGVASYDGFLMPPGFHPDVVRETIDYDPPAEGHRWVVTFPKCGTTWTQMIISLIASGGQEPTPGAIGDVFFTQPFLELMGVKGVVDHVPAPIALKTHLPFGLQPRNRNSSDRFLYVVRNPKDTAVSWYHHYQRIEALYAIDWTEYIDKFIDGTVGYGDYFDHVTSWWLASRDPRYADQITFLTYEDMKRDPIAAVKRIATFLGPEYTAKLEADPEMVHRVKKFSSFDYMSKLKDPLADKENPPDMNDPNLPPGFKLTMKHFTEQMKLNESRGIQLGTVEEDGNRFVRKGVVNDWKNHFTDEQNERIKAKFAAYSATFGIDKIWTAFDWL